VEAVGILYRSYTRKDRTGLPKHYVVCGLQMRSSMVVTTATRGYALSGQNLRRPSCRGRATYHCERDGRSTSQRLAPG
jgi:hypothetical protein